MTSKVEYKGNLRTEIEHLKSGSKVITDAPTDNFGKGDAFSPTDMVATSLASCMITVVGIYCNKHGLKLDNAYADVNKVMGDNPRRIVKVEIDMNFEGNLFDEKTEKIIKRVVETCPVQNSIHPDIEIVLKYRF